MKNVKSHIVEVARLAQLKGLTSATGGNISVKMPKDTILITRSGSSFSFLKEEDLLLLDTNGNIIEGKGHPSSEIALHLSAHKAFKDLNAVFHAHPTASLSLIERGFRIFPINFEARLMMGHGPILTAKTAIMSDPLDILNVLSYSNYCLLAKHGIVTIGKTLEEAYLLAELIEESAKSTVCMISIDKTFKESLKASMKEEVFWLTPFSCPLFGKIHLKELVFKIEKEKLNIQEAVTGFPPISVLFEVDEVADNPPRRLWVYMGKDDVRIMGAEQKPIHDIAVKASFPVMEAIFSGKTTLFCSYAHSRVILSGEPISELLPYEAVLTRFFESITK